MCKQSKRKGKWFAIEGWRGTLVSTNSLIMFYKLTSHCLNQFPHIHFHLTFGTLRTLTPFSYQTVFYSLLPPIIFFYSPFIKLSNSVFKLFPVQLHNLYTQVLIFLPLCLLLYAVILILRYFWISHCLNLSSVNFIPLENCSWLSASQKLYDMFQLCSNHEQQFLCLHYSSYLH